ncbi:hypothetical protein JCM3774_000162 [Rhodotorula dairenensis]
MAPRPAFVFSYNAQDADVAALASTSSDVHAGLGISHTRGRAGYVDDQDDWVPTYGPTTRRKGKMRFVAAKDPQFQVIPGYQDATVATQGHVAEKAPQRPSGTIPGAEVRSLYASIVGLDKLAATPASSQSEPVSRRASPPPPEASSATSVSLEGTSGLDSLRRKRPRTASPPLEPSRWRAGPGPGPEPEPATRRADIVLSSGSEEDVDRSEAVRTRGHGSPNASSGGETDSSADSDDGNQDGDDDLIVMDPLTGLPEAKPSETGPPPKRLQALLIHQLLPRASDSDAAAEPFVPPTQYAIKPDSPGWRLLTRQGWREGLPLGPIGGPGRGVQAGAGGTAGEAAGVGGGRLKVPLRAIEKHDRSGIGVPKAPEDRVVVGALNSEHARRAREERERERRRAERDAKDRRGKGERGMERQRKKEEKERKAWIAYMNR